MTIVHFTKVTLAILASCLGFLSKGFRKEFSKFSIEEVLSVEEFRSKKVVSNDFSDCLSRVSPITIEFFKSSFDGVLLCGG